MSNLDVEDLLRRTYADVAERTITAPPGDAMIVPIARRGAAPQRWAMLAAAAAVVVLVVAAAVALQRTGSDGPAGVDESTFVHVLPGEFPGSGGDVPTMPLVLLESSAERDVIEYAGDGDRLRIQVDRGDAVRPVEEANLTFDGVAARLDVDTALRRITWNPRPAMQVTVDWDRGDLPAVRAFADQLVFVDDAAWERAIARAGFGPYSTTDRSSGVVAEYRLPTTVPVTVEIHGWLHTGFMIRFPEASVIVPNIRQQCTASRGLVGDGPAGRIAVVAGEAGRATVRDQDGTIVSTVDVSVPIPGTDNYLEVVDLGDAADATSFGCEVTG